MLRHLSRREHLIQNSRLVERGIFIIILTTLEKDTTKKKESILSMVEPLLSGIVLGLIPITLAGLFVTAYLQYRRGDQLDL
jgi:cytochrome b6-f complex subunit 5